MRRFLLSILWFSILVIATLAVGEVFVRRIPNPYSDKDRALSHPRPDITRLILGDSQSYYGIMPDALGPGTFNLANVSQNPEYNLLLLRKYAPNLPNLREVVANVGYCTLFDPDFEHGEWNRAQQYQLYMSIRRHPSLSKYNFEITDFEVYAGKLKKAMMRQPLNARCDSLGFGLGFVPEASTGNLEKAGEWAAERHTDSTGRYDYLAYNLRHFNAFVDECSRMGVKLTVVTTPVSKPYFRHMNPRQYEIFQSQVRKMAAEKGFRYLDYEADSRFLPSDFYDGDHLNTDGALKFSRILRSDIASE